MSILGFSVIFPQEISRGISVLAIRVYFEPVIALNAAFFHILPGCYMCKVVFLLQAAV